MLAMMAKFTCDVVAVVVALRNVAPLPGGVWWPAIAGIALMAVGFAIRTWSVASLGRFFRLTVVIQDGHRVVNNGPYRYVRHPAYLGLIVIYVGLGLVASDWISLGIMVVAMTIALSVRISSEERVLVRALGGEYALYMRHTARLVPGVY
jgi:protein-S-isoprenylcysteine O-methyltransferase Ste14